MIAKGYMSLSIYENELYHDANGAPLLLVLSHKVSVFYSFPSGIMVSLLDLEHLSFCSYERRQFL